MSDTNDIPGCARNLDEEAPIAPVDDGRAHLSRRSHDDASLCRSTMGSCGRDASTVLKRARKAHEDAWDECIRYYNNSQDSNRTVDENRAGNRYFSVVATRSGARRRTSSTPTRAPSCRRCTRRTRRWSSRVQPQLEAFVATLEKLVNASPTCVSTRAEPEGACTTGVLTAELCNLAWIEYGYVERPASSVLAQEQIAALSQELVDAEQTRRRLASQRVSYWLLRNSLICSTLLALTHASVHHTM